MSQERVLRLLDELDRQRADFVEAIGALPAGGEDQPILEDWTARDLVWHCGFWSDHGAEALELALAGRGYEFRFRGEDTDAMNASEVAVGRRQEAEAIRAREESAYARLRAGIAGVSDELLDLELGNGDTVEAVIRYDGPDHYREHAEHLRGAAAP